MSLREKDHLEYIEVDGRINIKMYLHKVGWGKGVWTGLIWHRIGTGGEILRMRQ